MTELIIDWNHMTQKEWDRHLSQAEHCSFQQAWAYGTIFNRDKVNVNRFVVYDGLDPIGMGQVVTRRFFGFLKVALLLRAPLWLRPVSADIKKEVLEKIRLHFPLKSFNLFAFSPDETESHQSYKDMGFRRVITGYSTVLLDINRTEDDLWQNLYGKTRTSIRKAEKSHMDIQYGDHHHYHIDWLLKHEKKQQKDKKYQGLPTKLVKSYGRNSAAGAGVFTAFALDVGMREPLAGALFLRHGRCATYHIGWNGPEGRNRNALHLLLWKTILKLKSEGVVMIDLGGINTEDGADIARFKLGFGGTPISLIGTYM
ncbi:lipid II:glycine glycyltransferase FemX [Paremcibacter congregatus]|uniref:lipid II:glycine glycyltransferase FemX n=1 Tax=Paremcibacter congregatus TaxID=2043170 RepID=UPI003A9149AA